MISQFADPRTPRQSAEAIIRRGRLLDDPEMISRGQQALRYAEEQEALALARANRPRPSEVYEPSRMDPGGSLIEGVYVGGQITGLLIVAFWFLTLFFSWKVVAVGYAGVALAGFACWVGYCAVRRARQ
jgi:hypothetical protein